MNLFRKKQQFPTKRELLVRILRRLDKIDDALDRLFPKNTKRRSHDEDKQG